MKKHITSTLALLFAAGGLFAQSNVHLVPNGGTVCNPMPLSISWNGNSFTPVSYLWSTGETSPTINIIESDTYTVTVTGTMGNSGKLSTYTKSAYYNVLDMPTVTPLTDLWVCKGDTVRLAAVNGYDAITWSNGDIGTLFQKQMNYVGVFGSPQLDTMTVNYTASLSGVCTTTSQSYLLRAIRKPDGVGRFYQNKMNISLSDSIPAGLILEYLYPVTYEMSFTEVANPSNVIKYVPAAGNRKAPANILAAGGVYSVETTPIINGQKFCPGAASLIGISASGNRLGLDFNTEEGVSTFRVFDVSGKLLMERQAESFNNEWLKELTPQMVILQRTGTTTEVKKIQIMQ